MSTLLVDIGNTRAKWARLSNGRMSRQQALAHRGWSGEQIARRVIGRRSSSKTVTRIVIVSVAGARIDEGFTAEARRILGVTPEFFTSKRRVAGVTTMYAEPWRLGADRLAAAIGAYRAAKNRAVCVISLGTAMTLDLVDDRGRHRGGAIIPSPSLMVDSLLSQTHGIRRRAQGGTGGNSLFARSTRAAIGQGARFAAAAIADRAVDEARALVGRTPVVLLTGGGAPVIEKLIRARHRHMPDLVLQGLAVFASET
jgi:type III pantothenate kinase